MLQSISIRNIALIQKAELQTQPGFIVFTGETGAGKSLLLHSIGLAIGARADKSYIAKNCDYAEVEAVFEVNNDALFEQFSLENEGVIIIHRKFYQNGKNECRVNGHTFTLQMLKSLTEKLIDVHGQFEHQTLLQPSNHIKILDAFAGEKLRASLQKYQQVYMEWKKCMEELATYGIDEKERAYKLDMYSFQLKEIQNACITENEWEELLKKRDIAQYAEKIATHVSAALQDISYQDASTMQTISSAIQNIDALKNVDKSLEDVAERLYSLRYELQDIESYLKDYAQTVHFEENELNEIERTYDAVKALLKKYGPTIQDVQNYAQFLRVELEKLNGTTDDLEKLEKKKHALEQQLSKAELEVFSIRQDASLELKQRIEKQLADLGMPHAKFECKFEEQDAYKLEGKHSVMFYVAVNLGEDLKPLHKTMSGGEMSRFMLAVKTITASLDGIETLVFDEIDTGISGNIAKVVGEKMCQIANCGVQILCVTHLAQIASFANVHYFIEKTTEAGRTFTNVKMLKEEEKITEIARLSGGLEHSAIAKEHAQELLQYADDYKKNMHKMI